VKDKPKKNPVLTSPWKIGMLVALLLVVVGFGTTYFMVRVYGVELVWLEGSLLKWEVDSFAFFKEMYPLAAGVLVLSLLGYFMVASAVRRYRYFLNSGQDYRRLVQLADSIDDLTNPTQIARLKNYPELQSVLRSYGDQIREISSQLNEQQSQGDSRSVDLEMEIDTLLQGETSQDSLVEDRWWTPLYRKIETHIQEQRKDINELKKKVHDSKTALGRVALSTGRIVEQISGTAEEYPEILRAVEDLNCLAKDANKASNGKNGESPKADKGHVKAVVKEMENTLHKLEDGGKVLNEFSEENNGLALNIALMAAKGEASEHDLAQFAEKVRSTADRFNRLSATFNSMAQGLLGTCYSLKEKLDIDTGSDSGGNDEMGLSISNIANLLEERCTQLQERICCIGNEIHDAQDLVNRSIKAIAEEGSAEEEPDSDQDLSVEESDDEMQIERSGEMIEGGEEELVIDHGRLWGDDGRVEEKHASTDESGAEGFPLDGIKETPDEESETDRQSEKESCESVDGYEEPESGEEVESEDFPAVEPEAEAAEKEYVIPSVGESPLEGESFAQPEMPPSGADEISDEQPSGADEAWGDAAQHKWFKIDIDKAEEAVSTAPEEVEVREAADIASEEVDAEEAAGAVFEETEAAEAGGAVDYPSEPQVSGAPGLGQPAGEKAVMDETEEGEPVFDLYELGAVEYVEETIPKG
jgi:hypothetical protein